MVATERLGVAVPWGSLPGMEGWTRAEAVAFCVHAERLGCHSAWVAEAWGADAFTTLGYLAARTTRLRLATGIVNVFSRSPALLAQSIATLDELSGGRAILGIGASGARVIEDWHGVPFAQPVERTRECLQIVRLALSGARVDFAGSVYHVQRFRLATATKPRADLPIFVAGLGPRNLALTGELADGWLPIFASPATLRGQLDQVRRAALAAGRDPAAVEVAPFVLLAVAGDAPPLPARAEAEAVLRGHLAFYIGGMGSYYRDLATRLGFPEEAAAVAAAWAEGHRTRAAEAITPALLSAMAVCGTAAECRTALDELCRAGATLPIVMFPLGTTAARAAAALAALMEG